MSRAAPSERDKKRPHDADADAGESSASGKKRGRAARVTLSGHALAPDLAQIRQFILDLIARGAIAELISSVLGLLERMRQLNTELMARIATKSRKRPPSETLRRLQLELPLMFGAAANDARKAAAEPELEGPPESPAATPTRQPPEKKPRGPKNKHLHGRSQLPGHIERLPPAIFNVPIDQARLRHVQASDEDGRVQDDGEAHHRPLQVRRRAGAA